MKHESMAEHPEKIGRYTVEQVVGQGAMGIVYKGRDPGIGRPVAIKIVARHLLTHRAFTERFLAEARSAGQLSHPNILTIHDLGEDDGVPFLVMEYLPGKDLRQMIEAGSRSRSARRSTSWCRSPAGCTMRTGGTSITAM